jgi:VanZ family protein
VNKQALTYSAAAVLWGGFLFWLGSIPYLDVPGPQIEGNDKVAHLCAYAPLGLLVALAARARGWSPRTAISVGVAAALAVGIGDELHQRSVPGRTCDPEDALMDTAGGLIGAALSGWVPARVAAARAKLRRLTGSRA